MGTNPPAPLSPSPIDSSPEWQTGQWSKVSPPNPLGAPNSSPQPYAESPGPTSFQGPSIPNLFQAPLAKAPAPAQSPAPAPAPNPAKDQQSQTRPPSGFGPLPPGAAAKSAPIRSSGTRPGAAPPPPAPPPAPPPGSPFRSSTKLPGQAPPPPPPIPNRSSSSLPAQAPPLQSPPQTQPPAGFGQMGMPAPPSGFGEPPAPDVFQQALAQPPSPFADIPATEAPAQAPTPTPMPTSAPTALPTPEIAPPPQAKEDWIVTGSFLEEDNAAAAAAIEEAQNPRRSATGMPGIQPQSADPRRSASGLPQQSIDPRKSASGMPLLKSFSEIKRTPTQNNLPQLIFPKESQSQFAQPSELIRPEPQPTQAPPPEVPHTPLEPPSTVPSSAPPMESEWSRSQAPVQIPESTHAPELELELEPLSTPAEDIDILAQVEANYSAFAPQSPPEPEMESESLPSDLDQSTYITPSANYDSHTFANDAPVPSFEASAPMPAGTGLRQARGQIIAAESAFENQNYDVAVPLFERILKLLREDHGQNEPEYLSALQKLGDCYYYRGDYERAMPLYLESSNLPSQRNTSAGPGAIVNLQKLSKTYEKLERPEDAELAGGEAIELANMTLLPGHPLVPVVYKSYISLLEAAGAPKVKIKTYERELQDRLSNAAGSPDVPITQDYESDLKAWTNYESFDLEPVKQQHQASQMNKQRMQATKARNRGEYKKPFQMPNLKPIIFISAAVLVVGGMAVVGIGALLNTGPANKKQMIDARLGPYLGKSFISADGGKSLQVNQDGTASITFGADTESYPCEIGGGSMDMLSTARKMAGAQQDYVLKETKQGFEDPSGTILYSENADDQKILKAISKVGELAGFSFSRKKTRYPVKRKDFSDLGPGIELYSPLELKFAQFDEDEGMTRFNEALQDMKAGRPLFGPDGKPDIPPGLIECMSVVPFVDNENAKGIGFLIRAYNKEGKFIRGSDDSVRVLALKNGVEIPTVEKKDIVSPIKAQSKVTVFLELAKK